MSSIEKKFNGYNIFTKKNCLIHETNSCINKKSKLIPEKEAAGNTESEFENKIKKIFQRKKFFIDNQFDHNGVKNFLKEKDECLKKIELVDLDNFISYKNLNVNKKCKNEKNQYKSNKNFKFVDSKKEIKIKNNNRKVINSFLSNKSGDSIEVILELLK